jgi:hypothetical protein
MSFIFGLCFHQLFHKHFATSKKMFIWTQLFEMVRGFVQPKELGFHMNDSFENIFEKGFDLISC